MADALSDTTIDLVKATVPALEEHGTAITDRMYERLFQEPGHPRPLQPVPSRRDRLPVQGADRRRARLCAQHRQSRRARLRVERIAQKHVGLNILPEHYPFVAEALLGAIKDVLGDAATDEILAAWGEAYWFLADLLIAREAIIYGRLAAAPGGWNGWRDFAVESTGRRARSSAPSSWFRPMAARPAAPARAVSHLRAGSVPGVGPLKRNYSISSAPDGRAYRITVKREARPACPPASSRTGCTTTPARTRC